VPATTAAFIMGGRLPKILRHQNRELLPKINMVSKVPLNGTIAISIMTAGFRTF